MLEIMIFILMICALASLYGTYRLIFDGFNFKSKLRTTIADFSIYPHRDFVQGNKVFRAFYVSGSSTNFSILQPFKKKERNTPYFQDYGMFCQPDISAIERYLRINPDITVLNIPTEYPDEFTLLSMYKIIRIK